MTTEEFIRNFYLERKRLLESSFDLDSQHRSYVSVKIEELGLSDVQKEKLHHIIASLLTDTFYSILLGLDGSGSIGDMQEMFRIYGEDDDLISECGELEAEAYNYFITNKPETENATFDFLATLNSNVGQIKEGSQIKFTSAGLQTTYSWKFIEKNIIFPGDQVNTMIKLNIAAPFYGKLKEGMNFDVLQEGKLVGKGRILHVMNNLLSC